MRRHVVRDVDERRIGTDPEHDAFHRPGVVIARAEIGQQGDYRSRHAPSLSKGRRIRKTCDDGIHVISRTGPCARDHARDPSARAWRPAGCRIASVSASATSPSPENTSSAPARAQGREIAQVGRSAPARWMPGLISRDRRITSSLLGMSAVRIRLRAPSPRRLPPASRDGWRHRRRRATPSSRSRRTVSMFSSMTVGSMPLSRSSRSGPAGRSVADDDGAVRCGPTRRASCAARRSAGRRARQVRAAARARRLLDAQRSKAGRSAVEERVEHDRDDRHGDDACSSRRLGRMSELAAQRRQDERELADLRQRNRHGQGDT